MDYERQWQRIMTSNMFSEPAVITDGEAVYLSLTGIFCSGSYEEDSPAPYSPKRLVSRECFQVSSMSIPDGVKDPWETLKGWDLLLTNRSLAFRILDISGKRGGMLTLYLQEKNTDG